MSRWLRAGLRLDKQGSEKTCHTDRLSFMSVWGYELLTVFTFRSEKLLTRFLSKVGLAAPHPSFFPYASFTIPTLHTLNCARGGRAWHHGVPSTSVDYDLFSLLLLALYPHHVTHPSWQPWSFLSGLLFAAIVFVSGWRRIMFSFDPWLSIPRPIRPGATCIVLFSFFSLLTPIFHLRR